MQPWEFTATEVSMLKCVIQDMKDLLNKGSYSPGYTVRVDDGDGALLLWGEIESLGEYRITKSGHGHQTIYHVERLRIMRGSYSHPEEWSYITVASYHTGWNYTIRAIVTDIVTRRMHSQIDEAIEVFYENYGGRSEQDWLADPIA